MNLVRICKEKILLLWEKGAIHIIGGTFLTKFVTFFGSIFLVQALTKTDYGILSYAENLFSYIYLIAGLGLNNSLIRFVVLGETTEEKYRYCDYALRRGSVINLVIMAIAMVAMWFYPHPVEFLDSRLLILVLVVSLPFQYVADSDVLIYRGMVDNKRYAAAALLSAVMVVALKYVGAVADGVSGAIIARIFSYAVLAVLLTVHIRHVYFANQGNEEPLSKSKRKTVNVFSFQYMITNGIWMLFSLNDVFLLGQLCNDADILADYRVAYVLPGTLTIISTAIGIFVVPYFVKHETDKKWVWNNYKKVMAITFVMILLLSAVLFFGAELLVKILYGQAYLSAVPLMRVMVIGGLISSGLRYTTANLLSAMGQVKYNMIVSAIGVLTQVALDILLIPSFGAMGTAFVQIIVYALMAALLMMFFTQKYRFKQAERQS